MPRYITRAIECGDEWYEPTHLTISVSEAEDKPIDTGLFDENGEKLYRVSDRTRIGFIQD